jgi:hypothetical protein
MRVEIESGGGVMVLSNRAPPHRPERRQNFGEFAAGVILPPGVDDRAPRLFD